MISEEPLCSFSTLGRGWTRDRTGQAAFTRVVNSARYKRAEDDAHPHPFSEKPRRGQARLRALVWFLLHRGHSLPGHFYDQHFHRRCRRHRRSRDDSLAILGGLSCNVETGRPGNLQLRRGCIANMASYGRKQEPAGNDYLQRPIF